MVYPEIPAPQAGPRIAASVGERVRVSECVWGQRHASRDPRIAHANRFTPAAMHWSLPLTRAPCRLPAWPLGTFDH
jgi:hypothetical protein